MRELPEEFLERMENMLGEGYGAFLKAYDRPAVRGLRANTLKIGADALKARLPFALQRSALSPDGFIAAGESAGLGKHPDHQAGAYYIQEPSAMAPAEALGVKPGMRVLDLCAAPGGKASAIAAALCGRGLLVANEAVKGRARTLLYNLERMGAVNAVVTSAMPDALAAQLPGFFDAILVDAPCSGEGMFRKDPGAIADWSIAHVLASAKRQKAILTSAVRMLKPGGRLVYATSTFAPEENEGVCEWAAGAHPWLRLERMERLYPHTSEGEGQFFAVFVSQEDAKPFREHPPMQLARERGDAFRTFLSDTFSCPPEGTAYRLPDNRVILLVEELPACFGKLPMLGAGVAAGEVKAGRFVPAHGLFMAEHGGTYARRLSFGLEDGALHAFLAGGEIPVDAQWRGYAAVAVDGLNLGFGKATGGVLKNHLPKGLRMA